MTDGTLHTRYIDATVDTPAQTLQAAPQNTTIVLGTVVLLEAHLIIPPGHAGLTGWQLRLANQQVVPYGPEGSFIVGDDDKIDFIFERIVGLGLVVRTYNLGQYSHSHLCRMKVTDLPVGATAPAGSIAILDL